MANTNYAVPGVKKLTGKGYDNLASANSHNLRLNKTEKHIDHSKSHLNEVLVSLGDDLISSVELKLKEVEKKPRKDAVKAFEVMLTASPGYFRESPENWGEYDQEKYEKWREASLKFLKDKFKDNLVHVVVHLDEATPHIHATIVPIVEKTHNKRRTKEQIKNGEEGDQYVAKTLDADSILKRNFYYGIHDEYAAATEHLGLKRGVKFTGAVHRTAKKFWKAIGAGVDDFKSKFKKFSIKKVVDNVMSDMKPDLLESRDSYAKRVATEAVKRAKKRNDIMYDFAENTVIKNEELKLQTRDANRRVENLDIADYESTVADYESTKEELNESKIKNFELERSNQQLSEENSHLNQDLERSKRSHATKDMIILSVAKYSPESLNKLNRLVEHNPTKYGSMKPLISRALEIESSRNEESSLNGPQPRF